MVAALRGIHRVGRDVVLPHRAVSGENAVAVDAIREQPGVPRSVQPLVAEHHLKRAVLKRRRTVCGGTVDAGGVCHSIVAEHRAGGPLGDLRVNRHVLTAGNEVLPGRRRRAVRSRAGIVFRVPERDHAGRIVHRGREEALHVDGVVLGDLLGRQDAVVETNRVHLALPAVGFTSCIHRAPAERDTIVSGVPCVVQPVVRLACAIYEDVGYVVVVVVCGDGGGRIVRLHLCPERPVRSRYFPSVKVHRAEGIVNVVVEHDIARTVAAPEQDSPCP